MPASRLRTFLELSIDAAARADSIIRRHSCAWQAVSDSQARSSGSSSRPSGVIKRLPRKEKPAQGPVKSIRWCGSNTIMPRSHPWPGSEGAGKSRARGPAIAMRSQQRPRFDGYDISHNVYYVQILSEDARVPLASITGLAMPSQEASLPAVPLAAWQLRLPPSSDQSLVHDPGDPAADQAAPRDNDLFLFKGGSIQSLIGNESQRSQ